ncbi:alpha glucosidase [Ponticoccus sp. SC2-23]|uniref:alpha-amylase family glycosyl hydrolase n=1 Tax=Alexandriicola marinus TaxID=2081710 RepID=UPI000FD9F01D|nr:alpha-amylase family glycosyl hydrolase [Alexandriicola marinus]MBM1222299.1 alpha glucosidase [Ponticoccus sp. SC6-9]MBM1224412.1 alpha glucosidase [Ponticoccus sp. SC6-15]MBM1229808.1 alpha glucosidase [Ponticoccus sp. SC6-38]MBM1233378.1 alpha glucosidase [Ponticoccus sp. SC6-45]MBM1236672.1 alpha glucosidase [Ponticoccus sp. SC6-49]MBM1244716.1 alpha glucosidase [Ponticoccus sp. SC2-64]MBM1246902.1 alpha glucosidase [Ponticoccus sp. SC6-42]MBM1251380.1 alpha glucosidase [Ponticoccus 
MNAVVRDSALRATSVDRDWWRGAVIYQIYPRSFQDSNGDGIGDLAGIVDRLPHIASLGVDAVWISPFFTSPMLDFGYDVSDYCNVDPMFGTLADFDRLVGRAHELGLKVMIDLVLSHTSDQHPWFVESRQSRDNPKADWYVWADAKPDGSPPNNWLSIFGGSAWHWDGRRMQYYLHNFLSSQPDLNFHNPDVQEALLDVERFWLKRGVDGFRLDTINFYFADKELRDNPALPPEARNDSIAPAVNPYNWQDHIHSKNQPENLEFLRRFRAELEPYGAAAVGEVGDAQRGLEIMAEYTSGGDKVQMCYPFEMLQPARLTAATLKTIQDRLMSAAPDAWPCWSYSNHDVVRHITRWDLSDAAARAYATLILCQRGSVCLYQGEELGLPEAEVAFEDLQDPYGIEFWPEFKGRDGCRTPMVWEQSNLHGGFSDVRPWLPVSEAHVNMAASVQDADPRSMLSHYRAALALRKAHPALVTGELSDLTTEGDVVRFVRRKAGEEVFCAFNLSADEAVIAPPGGEWASIGATVGGAEIETGQDIRLGAWQCCLARRAV